MLAHLRFPDEASRGRRYPQPAHPYRPPYQRDRDRIIHARSFRRLKHKTQVFTTPDSDHFRDRLTHTLEVSQIARSAASALELNEDLVEALALAHDLGHPPFGHAGEQALDHCLSRFGERFDHNLHALRIVETFERRYADFPGLNLTFEVREGLIKHSADYDESTHPELSEYLLDQRPLLEQQLIDPADEIAYQCADLEDGIESGLLDVHTARERAGLFDTLYGEAVARHPEADQRLLVREALRRLLDALVSGLIEGTVDRAAGAQVRSYGDVRQCPQRLAHLSDALSTASAQLRVLLHEGVYQPVSRQGAREEPAELVGELFDLLLKRPEELPPGYRQRLERDPPHRCVCDYIAGMTDQFLLRLHGKLVTPASRQG